MKKILASTAILAAMSGTAFAAAGDTPATNHPAPGDAQSSASLLNDLLGNAATLSASLSNVAQNLNSVDGSINVDTNRDYSGLANGIDALSLDGTIPFGSFSTVGSNVFSRDLPASLLNVLNPLTLTLGDLSTTSIGAMQSGALTGTVNAGGIVDRVSSAATASTTTANSAVDTYGGIAHNVAFQNIAVNSGDINGSVQLSLNDVNSAIGKIGTTAIGAMGSGSLTATVTGNMGNVTENTASIVNALVGN